MAAVAWDGSALADHAPNQLVGGNACRLRNFDEIQHIHLALPCFNPPHEVVCPAEFLGEVSLTEAGCSPCLHLRLTMQDRARWADAYAVLRAWRQAAEAHGVLVMQISRISLDEMRGCSLAMFPMPIVLLNGADTPLGRVFTLLHELAHLARHESGLCDVVEERDRPRDAQQVEVFCNHVAGAALVPQDVLLHHPLVQRASNRTEWTDDQLATLRSDFWASREVILRRLLIAGKTSQAFYQRKRDEFLKQYEQVRDQDEGGFVPFPRKVVLGNGRLLTSLVLDAYEARAITGSELSRVLGTKLDHLPAIISELRGRDAA